MNHFLTYLSWFVPLKRQLGVPRLIQSVNRHPVRCANQLSRNGDGCLTSNCLRRSIPSLFQQITMLFGPSSPSVVHLLLEESPVHVDVSPVKASRGYVRYYLLTKIALD